MRVVRARLQPHRAPSRRRVLRIELREADRRDGSGPARAGRARGRSEAHARLLRRARHRARLLALARAGNAGRGVQPLLRARVVDRAAPEFPDREVDAPARRDSSGPRAPATLRRARPARLPAEDRKLARMAHDDPARADAHRPARVLAPTDRVTPALAGTSLVPGARVALVHDWLTGMRGGERCLEILCELFPDAPLFTLLHVPGTATPTIERRRVITSFVQRLPRAAAQYRYYLPAFPLAIRRFDLSGYDLVLSMSHCVAKGVRVPPRALHLCYCFSPMRYLWDLSDDYFDPGHGLTARVLEPPVAAALKRWDRKTAGVHRFVAISRHIADRIRRAYDRPADVIYPPVDVQRFEIAEMADEYYLVVGALVAYERVEARFDGKALRARAEVFDRPVFKQKLGDYITARWNELRVRPTC